MTNHNDHAAWLAQEPTYPSSPEAPPNTPAEYLVSVRRAHWPPNRRAVRRVFHSYSAAADYRARLEAGERRSDANVNDHVFVTIHRRDCRPWCEIP